MRRRLYCLTTSEKVTKKVTETVDSTTDIFEMGLEVFTFPKERVNAVKLAG